MAKKIVCAGLDGGPCSGKTTALKRIKEIVSAIPGWDVYVVEEAATFLAARGIFPPRMIDERSMADFLEYERKIVHTSRRLFEEALAYVRSVDGNVLIMCDRPIPGMRTYLPEGPIGDEYYQDILRKEGLVPSEVFAWYDGILKLTTAADGAEPFYTLENNERRDETPEEACVLDKRTERVYLGHPHLRVIDNTTDFEGKMQRLLHELFLLMGVPQPLEVQRKYLVHVPDCSTFITAGVPYCEVRIEQAYLTCADNEQEVRIRRYSRDMENWTYSISRTTEWRESGQRIRTGRIINHATYHTLFLHGRDVDSFIVEKVRYCFLYEGIYFALDHVLCPLEICLLEVKPTHVNQRVALPPFVDIKKSVTDNPAYRMREIARRSPVFALEY